METRGVGEEERGCNTFYFKAKISVIRAITTISDSDNVEARGTLRALKKRAGTQDPLEGGFVFLA